MIDFVWRERVLRCLEEIAKELPPESEARMSVAKLRQAFDEDLKAVQRIDD